MYFYFDFFICKTKILITYKPVRNQKIIYGQFGDIKIQPVHSEGDQPWDFFGRNDAKAETPVLLPPHVKS